MSNLVDAALTPGNIPAAAVPSVFASVLVIDDDALDRRDLQNLLEAEGFDVATAASGEEGVELLRGRQFEVAITDLVMPGMDGIQAIAALMAVDPDIAVILQSGCATVDSTIAALRQGARDYLLKPLDKAKLRPALLRALAMRRSHAALPLYEASRPVLATRDRENLIPAILALAQRTMRASAVGLALVPSECAGLEVHLSDGHGPFTETAAESIAQVTLRAGEPLRNPCFGAGQSPSGNTGIPPGSVLTYPLGVQNGTLGALVLWRDQGGAQFSAFDVERGRRLADEVIIALDNARLHRKLTQKVEELESARAEVARLEAGARAVIATAQEAIVLFDKEGVVRDINPKALEMFGRTRHETVGYNLADFALPARLLDVFRQHVESAYREGRDPVDGCMEVMALRKNGEEFPLEISTVVIETPQGKLLSTFARDITERKQAEQALAKERDLLHALMNNVPDCIYFKDRESRFIRANMALARLFGLSDPAEMVGKTDFDFFTPEHAQPAYADEQEVIRTGKPMAAKVEKETWPDGRVTWASTTKVPLRDDSGNIVGTFGISRDITEQKRAEEALRENEEKYRVLYESSRDAIMTLAPPEWKFTGGNSAAIAVFGAQDEQEFLAAAPWTLSPEYQPDGELSSNKARRMIGWALERGSHFFEWTHKKLSGEEFFATVGLARMTYRGQPLLQAVVRDITEQKRAEAALQESEQRYRLLFSQMLAGFALLEVIWDENGVPVDHRYLELNTAFEKHTGLARDRVVGRTIREVLPGIEPFWIETYGKVGMTGESVHFESYAQPLLRWFEVTAFRLRPGYVAVTFADITRRKQAEEKLLLKQFSIEHASDDIIWLDSQGRIVYVNEAACRSFGRTREELNSLAITDIDPDFPPGAWQKAWEQVKAAGSITFEARHITKLGKIFPVEVTANHVEFGGKEYSFTFSRDISQRKEAEQQTRLQTAALESAANGIVITDPAGRILWVNPAFTRLTGYSSGEILGQNMRILKSGQQDIDFYRNLWKTLLSGEVWQGELVNRRKDGTLYTDDTTITPVRGATGVLTHFVAIKQDASGRRQAEQALEERTAYLNALFEVSPVGIAVLDTKGNIQMSNSSFEKLFLYSREEIFGANLDDLIVPSELAAEAKTLTNLCLDGGGVQATSRRRRKDGRLVDTEVYGVPLVIEGELRGYLGLYQDITERKRAEADLVKYADELEVSQAAQEEHAKELARLVEELAKERDLLGTVMDNLPDYIFYKDPQSRFLRTNPAHAKALGLSDPHQAVGKTDLDFFPEGDAKAYISDEQQVIESGQPLIGRIERVRHPDGQYHWFSTSKVPIRDTQGRVTGLVGISRDTTEHMQAEETLRASEERYRELFENASDIVYTTGLDTRLTSLNRVGQKVLGYSAEEAAQLDLRQLVTSKHWELAKLSRERLMAGASDIAIEVDVTTKDGREMLLEVKPRLIYKGGKPVGVQGIARDITGRDTAEMELRHAQKLESVGRLASGIAHEINTPIQFVGDNTRFLQDSFGGLQTLLTKYQGLRDAAASGAVSPELLKEVHAVEEESDCEYLLEEIPKALSQTLDGVTRVATIVRAMKEFAHPEGKEMAAADLNRALLSTLTVARNELKYVADVETSFGDLPLVVCNIGDLNQVFLNLLVNAAHAIGEKVKGTEERGRIRICTWREEDSVLIAIKDTGGGIPEDIRGRIFDPFFTTKEVGRGTGQGLAIARSVVVDRHKGALTFDSEVGKGTTFFIRLPVEPGEPSKETRVP